MRWATLLVSLLSGASHGFNVAKASWRSRSLRMSAEAVTSTAWPSLQQELDELPVFVCTNGQGEPLQYERDGQPLIMFFADIERAQQELAFASSMYPELGLELLPIGLGQAYNKMRQGLATLVPSETELEAARPSPDADWPGETLPLFGCLKMRKPQADGGDSMPLVGARTEPTNHALCRRSARVPT